MLRPRPPFACLLSTTVLCFRRWEFRIGKKTSRTLNQRWHAAGIEMRVSSPQAHLHLLGLGLRLCKRRPASVWLTPLWSVWGRRRSYCWSPLCTAERSQILSVGIEESTDMLPSGAIMNTMNIFPVCHLRGPILLAPFGLIGFPQSYESTASVWAAELRDRRSRLVYMEREERQGTVDQFTSVKAIYVFFKCYAL